MEAGTVLLEPYYSFQLELPQNLADVPWLILKECTAAAG